MARAGGAGAGAAGCHTFFVATAPEGVDLRAAAPDARILVLPGLWPGWEVSLIAPDLIPALGSDEQLAAFPTLGDKPAMAMSNLACSGERDHPLNIRQRESFQTVRPCFEGIESSLSSSSAIYLGPDDHRDLIRPGIAFHGSARLRVPACR